MIYPFLNLKHLGFAISPNDYKEQGKGSDNDPSLATTPNKKTNSTDHKYKTQAMEEAADL